MNGDSVKRIVALTRQKKSYNAMVKTSDLTRAEADAMIALCDKEIAALRAQDDLQLTGAPAPSSVGAAKASK